jgi:phage-related baseplate assembly protein
MYCLPQAQELQSYVDRDDIRNVATDVVVRCPIVCNVSVNAVIHYDPKKPVESVTARAAIRNYINQLGFVGRLTRSDIVQILKNLGAVSVDMPNQDMLYGTMHDALGVNHVLSGDALDVIAISNDEAMISKDTVIFVAEERNIQIQFVPNV